MSEIIQNINSKLHQYINLRRACDVFVLSFVTSFVCSFVRFSSLWPSFTLTVHIMKVYMEPSEEDAT